MLQERVVHGLGKADEERIGRAGARRSDAPLRGIGRRAIFGGDAKRLTVVLDQGDAAPIEPLARDHQRVAAAGFQRWARLVERRQTALDAARIEEDGEAAVVTIPE